MLFGGWEHWSGRDAAAPILAVITSIVWSLYILAYPPAYKKLSMFLLVLPVTYAFVRHLSIAPDYTFTDTCGRFLYIWYIHMSYEVLIIEFAPAVDPANDNWLNRLKLAWRVVFDRNHRPPPPPPAVPMPDRERKGSLQEMELGSITALAAPEYAIIDRPQGKMSHTPTGTIFHHSYSFIRFTAHHITQLSLLGLILTLNSKFNGSKYGPPFFDAKYGSFFRRLPESLNAREMYFRAGTCWEWTVISLFEYEFYNSFFTLLFVSFLRLDAPNEWPLSLCGHIREAWSVRQYWGKHWHNYIYISFTSHTQILTRKWLRLKKGKLHTRLIENTIVFAASGAAHSVVKKVQVPDGEIWAITWWYVAQMLPIVAESVLQHYWRRMRKWMGVPADSQWMAKAELAVGYAWVAWWYMWSVPKYMALATQWDFEKLSKDWDRNHVELESMGHVNVTD